MTPRLCIPQVIRQAVALGQPGAYALGDDLGGFVVGYVGRSDDCVRARLLTHERLYEFEYFVVVHTPDKVTAYDAECELFHAHRLVGRTLANRIHPAVPARMSRECRYCSFAAAWRHSR